MTFYFIAGINRAVNRIIKNKKRILVLTVIWYIIII